MIKSLEIENFRSIYNEKVTFEPLTVLVGANGSGKSNLVKAIELISEIPRVGLQFSLSRQGGREGIVPKKVLLKDIGKTQTNIKYTKSLMPPDGVQERPEGILVEHDFSFSIKSSGRIQVNKDVMKFYDVLFIAEALRRNEDQGQIPDDHCCSPNKDSSVTIINKRNSMDFDAVPKIDSENIEYYLMWLGLGHFVGKMSSPRDLKNFLKDSLRRRRQFSSSTTPRGRAASDELLTEPDVVTICDTAAQFLVFMSSLKDIRRYDLLLNELRREQSPSDKEELSKAGDNMPSALKNLELDKRAFARLKSSFNIIAPHIVDVRMDSLKTGKEFVEFVEENSLRRVESWHSSDGSLRALAILAALECAEIGDVIIIEEPEQNLHPWAVRTLIDHIREVMEEKSIQVILTTHSEQVLERVNPNEVRIATRDVVCGTKFKRIDQLVDDDDLSMGDVGRMWVKGLLGGVPSA
ncbi:AAA family ATPase [Marinobacter nauticus]|uniref:AAA family ATPase n=1 Tax=Marinobacter nauticus TaxID=2743 RepID=UPI001CFEFFBE|nr:AAA family ATPase [Marinobacter nauticus]